MAAEASETIARRIADTGLGLHPVSKVRDAIYAAALQEIRALRNSRAGTHNDDGLEDPPE